MSKLATSRGYSLVELTLVLIIMGVLATIAVRSLGTTNEIARMRETMTELETLATGITGDPTRVSAGVRSDYGYLGDIGSLPASLDALITNPGFSTWRGPYVRAALTADGGDGGITRDAWGKTYGYGGGVTISSTGGSSTITHTLANSLTALMNNEVALSIVTATGNPPGPTYKDSLRVILTIPDGAGSFTNRTGTPDANGLVEFSAIPIGVHSLAIVYQPTADTIHQRVNIDPDTRYYSRIQFNRESW